MLLPSNGWARELSRLVFARSDNLRPVLNLVLDDIGRRYVRGGGWRRFRTPARGRKCRRAHADRGSATGRRGRWLLLWGSTAVSCCTSRSLGAYRTTSSARRAPKGSGLDSVRVRVSGDFSGDPAVSGVVDYEVELVGVAPVEQLRALIDRVDHIAEMPNSLRAGTPCGCAPPTSSKLRRRTTPPTADAPDARVRATDRLVIGCLLAAGLRSSSKVHRVGGPP